MLTVPKDYNLTTFKQIDSTNDAAKRMVKSGDLARKALILAEEQTSGYGQRGRVWESLKGNLHLSIVLETAKPLQKLQELVFLTAVTVSDYIEKQLSQSLDVKLNVKLKWPNDVLINSKKVAGILLETIKHQEKQYVIIGIGVNLAHTPSVSDQVVTSLKEIGDIEITPEEFLSGFISQFNTEYDNWQQNNHFDVIRSMWQQRAYNLSKQVMIYDGTQNISGVFCGIDQRGAIILELSNGERTAIDYGKLL